MFTKKLFHIIDRGASDWPATLTPNLVRASEQLLQTTVEKTFF